MPNQLGSNKRVAAIAIAFLLFFSCWISVAQYTSTYDIIMHGPVAMHQISMIDVLVETSVNNTDAAVPKAEGPEESEDEDNDSDTEAVGPKAESEVRLS